MSDPAEKREWLRSMSAAAKRAYSQIEEPAAPIGFAIPTPKPKPRIRVQAVLRHEN